MVTKQRAGPRADSGSTLVPRLEAAAQRIAELEEHLRVERARRDELIVSLMDEGGRTWKEVARLAGVSEGQLHRVLARE